MREIHALMREVHAFWFGAENHFAVLLGFQRKMRLASVVLKNFQKYN